jgi:hypothetical protein
MLVMQELTVDKDTAVTMDARLGKPIALTVPKRDAVTRLAHVGSIFHNPAGWYVGDSVTARTFDGIFTAQVGPDAPAGESAFDLSATLEQAGQNGAPYNSPYAYYLAYYAPPGTFFTGLDRKVRDRDLAAVATSYSAQAPDTQADSYAYYKPSFDRSQLWSVPTSFALPIRRTEYFSTDGDVQWQKYLYTTRKAADGTVSALSIHQSLFTHRTPGRSRDQWTAAVFGPGLQYVPASFPFTSRGLTRNGDQLKLMPSLLSDNTGRESYAPGRGTLTVSKDGTVIRAVPATAAYVQVPGDPGTLQVTATQARTDPDVVASSVAVTWTFPSAHTTAAENLPVSVIRFTPPLDAGNTAPSGWPLFAVPFTVDHQGTAGVSTSASVQVSYDDGTTWSAAPVIRKGDRGVVLLRHPTGHGYVSLQGSAADAQGNAVTQTVIRAYRY